ncbi:MAG: hypothetical protein PUB69_05115 [Desulfovibrionaceae bacterium]|nr:hypothetical protein [Desulfovibrionaceae bacterium]
MTEEKKSVGEVSAEHSEENRSAGWDEESTENRQSDADRTRRETVEAFFGNRFSEKEQKELFLYLVIGIVLMELAALAGACIYGIINTKHDGSMHATNFPWLGYGVAAIMIPVIVMLICTLMRHVFNPEHGEGLSAEGIPQRAQSFYALVRGAPTVILLAGLLIIGALIYYLDNFISFLNKIGDAFLGIAQWGIAGFAAAWIVSYVTRSWLAYRSHQMEREYAFRQEVLIRTGKIILDGRYALTTELRQLPGGASDPEPQKPVNPDMILEVSDARSEEGKKAEKSEKAESVPGEEKMDENSPADAGQSGDSGEEDRKAEAVPSDNPSDPSGDLKSVQPLASTENYADDQSDCQLIASSPFLPEEAKNALIEALNKGESSPKKRVAARKKAAKPSAEQGSETEFPKTAAKRKKSADPSEQEPVGSPAKPRASRKRKSEPQIAE